MADPQDDERWRRETQSVTPVEKADTVPIADSKDMPTRPETPVSRPPKRPSASAFDSRQRERFEERGELGRGGMGRVFEAFDHSLDRSVAIKQSLTDDPTMLARFEREVRITAQLQHPGIVPVLDAGRDEEGRPYYVMRKIEGRPLADVIAEATTVAARVALVPRLLGAIDAMAYAHARGVIHRDLKPWNVLLGAFGETLVIDWGLARELAATDVDEPISVPPDAAGPLTRIGNAYGTPGFMAPEQARGEALDYRADVYALGAILFHALSGEPPFLGMQATKAIELAGAGQGPDLSKLDDNMPRELVTIIAKATAADADKRYANAGELAADVRSFTAGQLVAAHDYSIGELIGRWLRKHRLAVSIAGLAVVALAVVGIVAVRRVIDARDRVNAARASEAARLDELYVERADEVVDSDPERALAMLKLLRPDSPAWSRVPAIVDTALARGVAWGRVDHAHAQTAAVAASPDGTLLASSARDGKLLLHTPSLHDPPRLLATIPEADFVLWFDNDTLLVQTTPGELFRVARDTGQATKLTGVPKVNGLMAGPLHHAYAFTATALVELEANGTLVSTIPDISGALRCAHGLLLEKRTGIEYLPDGGVAIELASAPPLSLKSLATSVDGTRIAASIDDRIIEWKLGPDGPVESGRWINVEHRVIEYVGTRLCSIGSSKITWLVPGNSPFTRPSPIDNVRDIAQTPTELFVSAWNGTTWRIDEGIISPVGGASYAISSMALLGDHLAGVTLDGVVVSWDLTSVRTRVVRNERGMSLPTVLAGGWLWSEPEATLVLTSATDGTAHTVGIVSTKCIGSRYAMLAPVEPNSKTLTRLDLTTLAQTPVTAGFGAVACSTDGTRIALISEETIEIRDPADSTHTIIRVRPNERADQAAVARDWLVLGSDAGDFERIDLRTQARVRTHVAKPHGVTVDDTGRVAILGDDAVTLWDGATSTVVETRELLWLQTNPAGFVGPLRNQSLLVIDHENHVHVHHGGAAFAPSIALTAPRALVADTGDKPAIIDLVDGSRRRLPVAVNSALLSDDGTVVAGNELAHERIWTLSAPSDPTALRALLDRLTNATIVGDSTQVTFPAP